MGVGRVRVVITDESGAQLYDREQSLSIHTRVGTGASDRPPHQIPRLLSLPVLCATDLNPGSSICSACTAAIHALHARASSRIPLRGRRVMASLTSGRTTNGPAEEERGRGRRGKGDTRNGWAGTRGRRNGSATMAAAALGARK